MTADSSRPYRVDYLHTARTRILRCAAAAVRLGMANEYGATIRTIVGKLSSDPLTWGDPVNDFTGAKLLLFQRVYRRIYTVYAVHEAERIVFLKDCIPVLGHPLESTD
jgi:hypothetical protein